MSDFDGELWDGDELVAKVTGVMYHHRWKRALSWKGRFQTSENFEGVAWVFSKGSATLRLSDGRQGTVVLTVFVPGPPAQLEFEGWGPPPPHPVRPPEREAEEGELADLLRRIAGAAEAASPATSEREELLRQLRDQVVQRNINQEHGGDAGG